MPFKSEAQRRYLWMTHPALARKWAHEYPGQGPKNLPYHAHTKEKTMALKEALHPERRKGTARGGHITPAARGKYETLPGGRFPIPDKVHARAALSRLSAALKRGSITPAEAAKVRARALRMLGKHGG